jgi:hypothetical protein
VQYNAIKTFTISRGHFGFVLALVRQNQAQLYAQRKSIQIQAFSRKISPQEELLSHLRHQIHRFSFRKYTDSDPISVPDPILKSVKTKKDVTGLQTAFTRDDVWK